MPRKCCLRCRVALFTLVSCVLKLLLGMIDTTLFPKIFQGIASLLKFLNRYSNTQTCNEDANQMHIIILLCKR